MYSPHGPGHRGTESSAETLQTAWPSEEPKTNTVADDSTKQYVCVQDK